MAPLHVHHIHPRATLNRIHFFFYSAAIIVLLRRHVAVISLASPSTLLLLFADIILAFMWLLGQGFRWRPIVRREFPNLLPQAQLLPLDVFICTADPFKEPPVSVACTALSAMAFDYPANRLSVYVSDDGGSELTLFAFMEAAKFARYWLPFCRDNAVMERSPEAYFESGNGEGEAGEMKVMFEGLKERVESAVKRGYVNLSLVDTPEEKEIFMKWKNFTGRDHPSVIQILSESANDKDITGHQLPNLIYISREKRPGSPHHFKAGALNSLLRVSEAMTNAPVLLTLDCDMHSNDPGTPQRALCYLLDPDLAPNLAYVQFPQRYRGLNADDIYGGEIRRLFLIGARGLDGLHGPNYVGTGCFFSRRSLYGPPTAGAAADESKGCGLLRSELVLQRARDALCCKYDHAQEWGSKIGFRYGSLVEDFNTGYKLHCEGWRSLLCNPDRPAFLGHAPKNLYDSLSQTRRWVVGLYEVAFSRYCPLFYGSIKASLLTGFCYMYYALWGVWCFPIIIYALLPQLALLYDKPLFPKVLDPWFVLYAYLFLAAYGQDLVEFMEVGGLVWRWWSDQRMWLIKGIATNAFGTMDFVLSQIGASAVGFNLTSKADEEEVNKLYDSGKFFFGTTSPLFISMGTIAIVNLSSLVFGFMRAVRRVGGVDEMFLQLVLCGFVVANSLPVYEAMFFRKDAGKMSRSVINASILLACALFCVGKMIV